jgi:hypothetical protein
VQDLLHSDLEFADKTVPLNSSIEWPLQHDECIVQATWATWSARTFNQSGLLIL